ncbi:MAG: DUF2752 domain-containing protein [Planctomycetaceae bacterium]
MYQPRPIDPPIPQRDSADVAPTLEQNPTSRTIRLIRERHWSILVCSVAVVVLAFAMKNIDGGRVAPFGVRALALPELCGSRAWFGFECPGCGLTRSFIALAAGDVPHSVRLHRLGWLVALAVVLQIPYRLYAIWDLKAGIPQRAWPRWFGIFLVAVLLLNWIVRIAQSR